MAAEATSGGGGSQPWTYSTTTLARPQTGGLPHPYADVASRTPDGRSVHPDRLDGTPLTVTESSFDALRWARTSWLVPPSRTSRANRGTNDQPVRWAKSSVACARLAASSDAGQVVVVTLGCAGVSANGVSSPRRICRRSAMVNR